MKINSNKILVDEELESVDDLSVFTVVKVVVEAEVAPVVPAVLIVDLSSVMLDVVPVVLAVVSLVLVVVISEVLLVASVVLLVVSIEPVGVTEVVGVI